MAVRARPAVTPTRMTSRVTASLAFYLGCVVVVLASSAAPATATWSAQPVRNGLLAYSASSSYGLYVIDPERLSSTQRIFARKGSWPAWSPDGRRIAYQVARTVPRFITSVWTSDQTGRNRRKVIGNSERPDWSPNGRQLAYVRDDGVYIAQANGHRQRRIIRSTRARTFEFVRWSPTGSLLALTTDEPGVGQFGAWRAYLRPTSGGRLRRLLDDAPEGAPLAWAPDGRRLASYTCTGPERGTIMVFEVQRGTVEQTLNTPACPRLLAWAPDGASIAYCGRRRRGIVISGRRVARRCEESVSATELEKNAHPASPAN
jgi:Tol biopolymer transport system component